MSNSKEDLIHEVENFAEISKAQKLQLSKYESVEIERFSPSSFNSFRKNRITWALRYIFKFKSRYPMTAAYRGNAIEKQIQQFLSNDTTPLSVEDHVQNAIEFYHHCIISNLFQQGLYEVTAKGFKVESLATLLKGINKDKFPSVIESICATHNILNSHIELPQFTNSKDEDYGKYIRKLQKEYLLIEQGVREGIKYFSQFKGQEIKMQQRLEVQAYNLVIPTISFSDFETKEFIYELKTVSPQKFPEKLDKVSLGHKTQAAFNSKYRKKPTKLVYISSVSDKAMNDFHKEYFICQSAANGMNAEQIFKSYISPTGGKTTKAYVEKYLASMQEKEFEKPVEPTPIRIFDFSIEQAEKYDKVNYMDAHGINAIFEKANKNSFDSDIKNLCWSDPEEMMVDKDQKKAIEKIWGIELNEGEEDSEKD